MEEDLGSLAGGEQQAAHEIIACSESRESHQHTPRLCSEEQHQETEGGDYTPLLRGLVGPYLDPVVSSGQPSTTQYRKDIGKLEQIQQRAT